jgi:hypothetical protein
MNLNLYSSTLCMFKRKVTNYFNEKIFDTVLISIIFFNFLVEFNFHIEKKVNMYMS